MPIERYFLPDSALQRQASPEELRQIWNSLAVGPVHRSSTTRRSGHSAEACRAVKELGPWPEDLESLYAKVGSPQQVSGLMEANGIASAGSRQLNGDKNPFSHIIELKQKIPDKRLYQIAQLIDPILEARIGYGNNREGRAAEDIDREISGAVERVFSQNSFSDEERALITAMIPPMSLEAASSQRQWTDYGFGVYFMNNHEFSVCAIKDNKKPVPDMVVVKDDTESGWDLLVELKDNMPFQRERYVIWGIPPKHIKAFYIRNPKSTQSEFVTSFVFHMQDRQRQQGGE